MTTARNNHKTWADGYLARKKATYPDRLKRHQYQVWRTMNYGGGPFEAFALELIFVFEELPELFVLIGFKVLIPLLQFAILATLTIFFLPVRLTYVIYRTVARR